MSESGPAEVKAAEPTPLPQPVAEEPAVTAMEVDDPMPLAEESKAELPKIEAAKPDAPKPVPIMIQPAKPASTILTEPAKQASTGTEPTKPTSTCMETVKPASTGTETVKPASTGTEIVKPVSTGKETVKPTSAGTETVKPASTGTETVKPTYAGTKTVKPTSTGTETVKPISTGTEPAKPEFAKPEPVATDKTEKGPEPMETESQNSTTAPKKIEMKIINETLTSNVQGEKSGKSKSPSPDEEGDSMEEEEDDEDDDGEEEESSDDEDGSEDGEEEEESDEDDEGEEDDKDESTSVESMEPPPMPKKMLINTPAKTKKCTIKVMKVSTPGAPVFSKTPAKSSGAAIDDGSSKKRGRPTRADMAEREKERRAAIARGEPDPELKRKRRKPAKLKDAASEQEDSPAEEPKEKEKKIIGRPKKVRTKEEEALELKKKENKGKGKGRKRLTEEEQAQREVERKRKYKEMRDAVKAKKEKREAYLAQKRDEKRAQRELDKIAKAEHEKRMAELRAQYLDDNATDGSGGPGTPAEIFFDENSQSSLTNMSTMSARKRQKWGDVGSTEMSNLHNPLAHVSAETLFEYKWPLDGRNSEHYFLQEQVTEYLEVKSFKRKYPDCPRRGVEMRERDFLIEMRIVNETQADLGLTAIPSSAVLDIMCQEFYDKYDAYMTVLNERKERNLRNANYTSGGGDIKVEEATKIAAEFNRKLNQERKDSRKAFFDTQTFRIHYPKKDSGNMRVVQKPKLGSYPVALIPGQFVDNFKSYTSKELKYFPLNTVTVPPPKPGVTLRDMDLGSEGSESDSGSSSSGSSYDSDSESDEENAEEDKKVEGDGAKVGQAVTDATAQLKPEDGSVAPANPADDAATAAASEQAPEGEKIASGTDLKHLVDEVRPNAVCKMCQGNMKQNKLGVPEMMLNCTKCHQSCHLSCAELSLDLIQHYTGYNWECQDCKMCLICKDPADEDKMLFCDLCDRGYHIYCVGLEVVPKGRWHCSNCASCISCGTTTPNEEGREDGKWIHEMKTNAKGERIFSHTMCQTCHKSWKKGNYCPECNGVFDRDNRPTSNCWVCAKTYHISCVGLTKAGARFICGACQRRVQERTVSAKSGGGKMETPRNDRFGQYSSRTPTTSSFSRSGRRVTQINFANQF